MRFRTKLFIIWGGVVLLMLAGTLWPVQRTIRSSFDHIASSEFAGTRQSLKSFQEERIGRMRQAGVLLMNIPELRALIAEHNFELAPENLASLQERLDSLQEAVNVSFICVLDAQGSLISQNHGSPWSTLGELNRYVQTSPQALALMKRLFSEPGAAGDRRDGEYGVWIWRGKLYQVVGLPLVFSQAATDQPPQPDGALVMATPLTDDSAAALGRTHDCQISFLADGMALASSLPPAQQRELLDAQRRGGWPVSTPFDVRLGTQLYRSSSDPLVDPCSGTVVGAMLTQSSLAPEAAVERKVSLSVVAIMLGGLIAATVISFVLSGAVTRPVQDLVAGARRVAGGDLNLMLPVNRRDELGELATAFNEMVSGLRRQRELERMAEQSLAASRAKSQFLANMSHEIRTPLNGVIGMADLLVRTELSDQQRRYLGLIKSSGEMLATLINDLLDFSKIEAGKLELESIDFNLRQVIQDVVELLAQRARDKTLELQCEIAAGVPERVKGGPTRLKQILMNLVNNAIKFTDSGKVVINAASQERAGESAMIRFEVRDTGIGIPADRLDRLFKSFSQIDASTTRRYGGTGLGLAISKQLVELMGGSIGVQSQAGSGSTFWFTVTLLDRPREQQSLPEAGSTVTTTPINRTVRILLAEDNEANQIVASELLRTHGFHCDVTSNGRQAVEAAAEREYDLILMDCQMPEMDGLEATRAIREYERSQSGQIGRRRIPIVALSANASGVARERCEEAGMDGYCSKPFQPTHLLQMIGSLLTARPGFPPIDGELASDRVIQPTDSCSSKAEETAPFDINALLCRCSGKASLATTVLDKFECQAAIAVADLDRLLADAEAGGLARASHALKGTAGIVAAEPLRRAVAELEEIAKAGDLSKACQTMDQVRQEVDRCRDYLATARELISAAPSSLAGGA